VLTDYFHLLREWEKKYVPKQPDEEWNSLFAEAFCVLFCGDSNITQREPILAF